jgi:hypothetical protein
VSSRIIEDYKREVEKMNEPPQPPPPDPVEELLKEWPELRLRRGVGEEVASLRIGWWKSQRC